jgi:hypothetical protein
MLRVCEEAECEHYALYGLDLSAIDRKRSSPRSGLLPGVLVWLGHPAAGSSCVEPSAEEASRENAHRVGGGHFGLEYLLHHGTDHLVQTLRVRKQNVFDGSAGGLTFTLGHGGVPSRESGDVNNHPVAAPLSEFAELSAHYRSASSIAAFEAA